MKLLIAQAAVVDLEDISDFIAADSPRRAESFVLELLEQCQKLTTYPQRHALIAGRESTGLRRCVMGNYLIFYRVAADAIEIARILNSALDIDAILFPGT